MLSASFALANEAVTSGTMKCKMSSIENLFLHQQLEALFYFIQLFAKIIMLPI